MTQQAAAPALRRECHPAEVAAMNVRNAVILREALVQEGVVRPDQVQRAAILADDAVDEELGFLPERLAHVVVEVGKQLRARDDRVEIPQPQPLPCEVGREVRRSRIGDHSARLLLELLGPAQPAADSHVKPRDIRRRSHAMRRS